LHSAGAEGSSAVRVLYAPTNDRSSACIRSFLFAARRQIRHRCHRRSANESVYADHPDARAISIVCAVTIAAAQEESRPTIAICATV
jgi:hypothetical protein